MKTTRLLPWILFFSGAFIYVIGLWRACPLLSSKGYFFAVLMTGMFVTYVYQRADNLNQNDEHFASVCQMVALITVGVLLVGVLNVPLSPLEKGLFPLAFIVCLLGKFYSCVQQNIYLKDRNSKWKTGHQLIHRHLVLCHGSRFSAALWFICWDCGMPICS